MSINTARNFMRVAGVYGTKSANVAHLDASALYELAAPKTPVEVREEVERLIASGEVVTKATVEELRSRLAGAETRAAQSARILDDMPLFLMVQPKPVKKIDHSRRNTALRRPRGRCPSTKDPLAAHG